MNKRELINYIKNNNFWTEGAPGYIQSCIPFMVGFIRQNKYYSHDIQKYAFMFCESLDRFYEETSYEEKTTIFYYILEKIKKDSNYLENKINEWKKIKEELLQIFQGTTQENLSLLSNEQLFKKYNGFMQIYIDEFSYAIAAEACDPVGDSVLPTSIPEKFILDLTRAEEKSFMQSEKLDILKASLSTNLEEEAKKLSERYFWIRNNYERSQILSPKYFLKIIKEESKKPKEEIRKEIEKLENHPKEVKMRRENILRKLTLRGEEKLILYIFQRMNWWQDERKKCMLMGMHTLELFLKEIAKRTTYSFEDLRYLLIPEIKEVLLENKNLIEEVKKRKKTCVYIVGEKEEELILTGEEALELFNLFKEKKKIKGLKGFPTSKMESIIGEIQIILNPYTKKFQEGKVLVTTMTRPEFVPLMKKAKGIITDEGGLTCHAAIISRELKIPCIIGTKAATKILKDGNKVKMDMKTGEITILN